MADSTASPVAVALLFDAGEGGASTHEAVTASGAQIVYEAATRGFDRAELARAGADVVVIDLHGADDAEFDRLDALADEYRVIFNDAEVSSGLTGWDRARWQRHLGAKILGGEVDPPRPADVEAVPVPLRPVASAESATATVAVSDDPLPAPPLSLQDMGDPDASRERDEPTVVAVAASAAPEAPTEPVIDLDLDLPPAPDWSVDALLEEVAPPEPGAPEPNLVEADESVIVDADLDAWVQAALDEPDSPATTSPVDAGLARAEPSPDVAAAIEVDVPAAEGTESWGLLDFDSLPEVPAAPSIEAVVAQVADDEIGTAFETADAAPDAAIAAPEWSLDELLDDAPQAPPATDADEFGIEKVSAADFLAPEADDAAAAAAEAEVQAATSRFELELIPLEEAVAPRGDSDAGHENRMEALAASATRIRRVWVLGASVGGPEAVREFLAEVPRDHPALFLLAQHLGGEFLDIMARQLALATSLRVRAPEHGDRVSHGEVVVVPPGKRLMVDAAGAVVLRPEAPDLAYSPSIDTLLHDVADAFGAAAGAIVFSGIGRDAIDGSRYLVEKGGAVWLQQPETCVVASMVEGVRDTGVAAFTGSPAELARHLRESNP